MIVGEPCFADQYSEVHPSDEEAYVSVLPCAEAHPYVVVGALVDAWEACVAEDSSSSFEGAYVA